MLAKPLGSARLLRSQSFAALSRPTQHGPPSLPISKYRYHEQRACSSSRSRRARAADLPPSGATEHGWPRAKPTNQLGGQCPNMRGHRRPRKYRTKSEDLGARKTPGCARGRSCKQVVWAGSRPAPDLLADGRRAEPSTPVAPTLRPSGADPGHSKDLLPAGLTTIRRSYDSSGKAGKAGLQGERAIVHPWIKKGPGKKEGAAERSSKPATFDIRQELLKYGRRDEATSEGDLRAAARSECATARRREPSPTCDHTVIDEMVAKPYPRQRLRRASGTVQGSRSGVARSA